MAKPKNRQTVYVVLRTQVGHDDGLQQHWINPVVVGVYLFLHDAEEAKGRYIQELVDKDLSEFFEFEVNASTYYDE